MLVDCNGILIGDVVLSKDFFLLFNGIYLL